MAEFFPRQTVEWSMRELRLARRVSLSLAGMAALTGVAVRLYRWMVLSHGAMRWWELLGAYAVGYVLLLGLATAYLGNHPVRQWVWRAPLFAVLESVSEAVVSAVLIAVGVERLGTEHAQWADWLPMAVATLLRRLIVILVFAALLAGVVQWVRIALLKHEHRESTAFAIHEARVEEEAATHEHRIPRD